MTEKDHAAGGSGESGAFDGYAPMPLEPRESDELGLGPRSAPTWANGRPEYGGLPPYGTPYVPPTYTYPTGGAPGVPPQPQAQSIGGAPAPGPSTPPYAQAQPSPYAQPGALAQAVPYPTAGSGYAAPSRSSTLPPWAWTLFVLLGIVILVVVIAGAARLVAGAADTPAGPGPLANSATPGSIPSAGSAGPMPEGTVTLDTPAGLPADTVIGMASTAEWEPYDYDGSDKNYVLGPAAPGGEDAWQSPCYFSLRTDDTAQGDTDREASEFWGEVAQKYPMDGTTVQIVAPLLVPGPNGTLYEFAGYTEIDDGPDGATSLTYTRADAAADRSYTVTVRCDGAEVPRDVLDTLPSQFALQQ